MTMFKHLNKTKAPNVPSGTIINSHNHFRELQPTLCESHAESIASIDRLIENYNKSKLPNFK